MSRQILCLKCGADDFDSQARVPLRSLHALDVAQGWSQRRLFLSNTHVPEKHGVTVGGVFEPMDDLHCDLCNEVITGQIVVAVSTIPPEKEMRDWESDYGKIMTPEEVAAYRRLAK